MRFLVPLLAASLKLRPLCDEAVCDGVFGGQPEGGRVAPPPQRLHLKGRGDLRQSEPASVLQLGVVNVHLDNRQRSQAENPQGAESSPGTHLSVGGANPRVAAEHQRAAGEGPVLRAAVGDGVHLQTHLLRHFPAHRLLQRLTWDRLRVSGGQSSRLRPSTGNLH